MQVLNTPAGISQALLGCQVCLLIRPLSAWARPKKGQEWGLWGDGREVWGEGGTTREAGGVSGSFWCVGPRDGPLSTASAQLPHSLASWSSLHKLPSLPAQAGLLVRSLCLCLCLCLSLSLSLSRGDRPSSPQVPVRWGSVLHT